MYRSRRGRVGRHQRKRLRGRALGAVWPAMMTPRWNTLKIRQTAAWALPNFTTVEPRLSRTEHCDHDGASLMRGDRQGIFRVKLAQQDLLDVISSDYVPAALLQSALMLWGVAPRHAHRVNKPRCCGSFGIGGRSRLDNARMWCVTNRLATWV